MGILATKQNGYRNNIIFINLLQKIISYFKMKTEKSEISENIIFEFVLNLIIKLFK